MQTDEASDGVLPDEVLTFGGSGGRTYHRVSEPPSGGVRPYCGQHGRNPLRKDRAVIESHYDPCPKCFPNATDHE